MKAAVFLFRADDQYASELKRNLEDIQKENQGKIEFTFFDGKGNQVIQNQSIDEALNEDFDLFVVNLVDAKIEIIKNVLDKIVEKDIPLILDGTPSKDVINYIKPYKRNVIIGSDNKQAGILQGKIIVDAWNANKQSVDKNNDDVLQYIMLQGKINHPGTINRTKYSILEINDTGVKTQELASQVCDWEKSCAKTSIESLFLKYGNKIEAIIANNDAMAIGAIEALQKYGYNEGNKDKNILVVGVDAIPEAKDLVDKGIMTGTVIQDARAEADSIYSIGMNLIAGKAPLDGTNYILDEDGILRLPYKIYSKTSE
ncbi:galactose ABC transporter substrate-binding protein [Clostridium sp.]|uniref:galactose ABC transporter substrate-binding protein n=1 Tax=Clostridium sp. TaxID=1506 RepID=UPI00261DCB48|nr:galactose ABC transporter substrate-binding protein [Clostridium sp.]